ncbi:hypothetical protein [Pseudonocardia sp. ICBG1293]|uniref:hypothetical protein n=1 Tax=Pseudonocardia sp. ICBG1293 TaxID=2844382 RepID=UPI001CCC8FC4|nr:hypothetical protein [Pseudonocardia sp. ICBG1293]
MNTGATTRQPPDQNPRNPLVRSLPSHIRPIIPGYYGDPLWTALLILTGWRLTVLARTDEPTDWNKAITLLFAIAAASNTFGLSPVKTALDAVTPGLSYLCGYTLLTIMYSGFVYLFASGEKSRP